MMRLPDFRYLAPRSAREAAAWLRSEGAEEGRALPLAGGTDLLPNMKRRQQTPGVLVALRGVEGFREVREDGGAVRLGAGLTLTALARDGALRARYRALFESAVQVATPHLRSMGTLGGNLCLDTRCNYYDQSYEWRKAISFCMKKDGVTCWVAPSSRRCLAVSSTDTAPALLALDARVRLAGPEGEREIPLRELYANDGIHYLTKRPDEVLTEVVLDPRAGWTSAYWKLRRRGSFDFPVLSVAAAARLDRAGVVEEARLVLGSVASRPLAADDAAAALRGRELTDAAIEEAATLAAIPAKPMDNTDFTLHWRKRVVREVVGWALRDLRGDDVRELRHRVARHALEEGVS
jgi:4-hydroxybenzoyl-CoA reductase subunit beta